MHGNNLKQINTVPRLIHEVCGKILKGLEEGHLHPEFVSAAFYDLEKPVFTSPIYMGYLGVPQGNEYYVSVDETYFNSPVTSTEQISEKIRVYKVICS